ncbi:MAG: right-handed parallel beta-helix repeat-containing protein, partial [Candidatus Latescibacteria bacterium]|nr:right-handed parallel beta-helix repeat-containing protein [Candidatus Latescibacterota bacterium]
RPVIKGCVSSGNSQGLFFCWGVSDGIVEDSSIIDNLDYGITIGHRDTDNQIRNCTIARNARCGILFRDEGEGFLAGHRNTIESCTLRDNGGSESGIAIDMRREPYDVRILTNRFEDSGNDIQKIGLRIEEGVRRERIENNTFHNMETDIQDERL